MWGKRYWRCAGSRCESPGGGWDAPPRAADRARLRLHYLIWKLQDRWEYHGLQGARVHLLPLALPQGMPLSVLPVAILHCACYGESTRRSRRGRTSLRRNRSELLHQSLGGRRVGRRASERTAAGPRLACSCSFQLFHRFYRVLGSPLSGRHPSAGLSDDVGMGNPDRWRRSIVQVSFWRPGGKSQRGGGLRRQQLRWGPRDSSHHGSTHKPGAACPWTSTLRHQRNPHAPGSGPRQRAGR